jgi:hypothetical protein
MQDTGKRQMYQRGGRRLELRLLEQLGDGSRLEDARNLRRRA